MRKLSLPWTGLIPQLFFFIILPVTILLLIFTVWNISQHQQEMRSLVAERDERLVAGAAAALSVEIETRRAILETLARLFDPENPQLLQERLAGLSEIPEFEQGVAIFSPEGELIGAGGFGSSKFWDEFASGKLGAFQAFLPLSGSDMAISSAITIPGFAEKIALLAYSPGASLEDPSSRIVVIGAFSPQALAGEVLSQAFPPEHVSVALVDRNGETLYQSGVTDISISSESPAVEMARQGHSGTTSRNSPEGELVVAFSPVPAAGWTLLAEESWDMIANPALEMTQVAPLVLVPLLLIFLAALWFGARQVIQPLQSLEAQAASVAWGNYQEIEKPVGGIAEIRRLQAELIHLTQKVKAAQESLRSYIGAITAGQEEERHRLARELHDDTLQSLIALKQRVQLAALNIKDPSESEALSELENLAELTIGNLRRFTRDLRPIYLEDLGLSAALEMLAREASQTGSVKIYFQRYGPERRLQPSVELAFYRIAQEALSNVLRHSNATQAHVNINYAEDKVTLSVSDNGKGFEVPKSPAEFAPAGHFGLLGLHERAELIGAKLAIHSTPGKGTQLAVGLPSPGKSLDEGSFSAGGAEAADRQMKPELNQ